MTKIHNFFFSKEDDLSTKVLFYTMLTIGVIGSVWGFCQLGN